MALDKYTRDVLIGILITVLTIIVAYAWNQYIVQGIDNYFKNNTDKAKLWKTLYLIGLTAVVLFIIFWVLPHVGFTLKQVSENDKINDKLPDSEKKKKKSMN